MERVSRIHSRLPSVSNSCFFMFFFLLCFSLDSFFFFHRDWRLNHEAQPIHPSSASNSDDSTHISVHLRNRLSNSDSIEKNRVKFYNFLHQRMRIAFCCSYVPGTVPTRWCFHFGKQTGKFFVFLLKLDFFSLLAFFLFGVNCIIHKGRGRLRGERINVLEHERPANNIKESR